MHKLYVNVYLVSRHFGGPEEGGWYYDAGEPLASIPVAAESVQGQTYVCGLGGCIVTRTCDMCEGKGEYEAEDEDRAGEGYMRRCPYCGLVPVDLAAAAAVMAAQKEAFKDDAGRREEIRVSLETAFAAAWPTERPHYE